MDELGLSAAVILVVLATAAYFDVFGPLVCGLVLLGIWLTPSNKDKGP